MKKEKVRIDLLLTKMNLAETRQKAQAMIMAGDIQVDGQIVLKPSTQVHADAQVTIKQKLPYVSRGGLKIEAGIQHNQLNIKNKVCLDIGASTGGFTDCLLQHGASKVYAVDVGYGQLAWKLRQDDKVIVIERFNARFIDKQVIPELIDLVSVDVSFISLKLIIPAVLSIMNHNSGILALIKPQFEVGKGLVGKGGVVRDPNLHEKVISDLIRFFNNLGLTERSIIPSPILGPKGNKEFVIYLEKA